ncbi:MAG: hypothetical protein H6739_37115 [Alphaproteobacteria bacterium]|nr:hypothetical protein [Alphaproteobacteria bacterium]
MANAIHKTDAGETLASIAQDYYAVGRPDGTTDDIRLCMVIDAIRAATPTSLIDLDPQNYGPDDTLPTSSVIFVPTLRRLNRQIFAGYPQGTTEDNVLADLRAAGFTHARKLLRYTQQEVVDLMDDLYPSTWTGGEIEKAYVVTALLNLDGMDRYTADYLHDAESIGVGAPPYEDLAGQTQVDLAGWLDDLVSTESRPAELDQQSFDTRWLLEARRIANPGVSELMRAVGFSGPFSSQESERISNALTATSVLDNTDADDTEAAECLAVLLRFQAAVLRGNEAILAGKSRDAVTAYQQARRHWHHLAQQFDVVGDLDHAEGLTLDESAVVSCCVCKAFPGSDDTPLGVSWPQLRRDKHVSRFRLRGFTFDELDSAEQTSFRGAISSENAEVNTLPRLTRAALQRAVQDKSWKNLSDADTGLVSGLLSGGDLTRARDFDAKEKEVLRRNVGGSKITNFFDTANKLDLFDAVGDKIALSEFEGRFGSLWASATAASVLDLPSPSPYPTTLLNNMSVTPYTKFVVLPGPTSSDEDVYIPILDASFVTDLKAAFKERLKSTSGEALVWDEACWANPGVFAVIATWLYCVQIPLGLRKAWMALGRVDMADRYGGLKVNLYKSDGTQKRDVSSTRDLPGQHSANLLMCSTRWLDSTTGGAVESGSDTAVVKLSVVDYCEGILDLADRYYRRDERDEALRWYNDALCAITNWDSSIVDEARAAMTGLYQTITERNASKKAPNSGHDIGDLSIFAVTYEESGAYPVLEDHVYVVRRPPSIHQVPLLEAQERITCAYDFFAAPTFTSAYVSSTIPELNEDDAMRPTRGIQSGDLDITWSASSEVRMKLFAIACVALGKVNGINAGMNWMGFRDDFVPPWSFQHLYQEARNLCDRALQAEQRVLSMLQSYEQAQAIEFQAEQGVELANAEVEVAELRVDMTNAQCRMSAAQAAYTVTQSTAAEARSAVVDEEVLESRPVARWRQERYEGLDAFVAGEQPNGEPVEGQPVFSRAWQFLHGESGYTDYARATQRAQAANNIPYVGQAASAKLGMQAQRIAHEWDEAVLESAKYAFDATVAYCSAAHNVAIAERDLAALRASQAADYLAFLQDQTLSSEGYGVLLAQARQTHEALLVHANRLCWLAQRALIHETLRYFGVVKTSYEKEGELSKLSEGQRMLTDLETLRAEYTSGQTFRFQEVKWTISLSTLSATAMESLRDSGSCTFVLRQQDIDRHFPGTYLHRVKDARVEIVGLVPPSGVRGVLVSPGAYVVRVPNTNDYVEGEVNADWTYDPLTTLQSPADDYTDYVLKPVSGVLGVLQLSQFDVRGDRAVLSAPQGMLKPIEHQGLESGWTLRLQRIANNFDFNDIVDVELTFWFLCAYDQDLEEKQNAAWTLMGDDGQLLDTVYTSFATKADETFRAFTAMREDTEALDVRLLSLDVRSLPLWQSNPVLIDALLASPLLGADEESPSPALVVRLCHEDDPAGVKLTLTDQIAYTALGGDLSTDPDASPNTTLETWLQDTFYTGSPAQPSGSPLGRWVIKVQPATAGSDFERVDWDGDAVETSKGPLEGTEGMSASGVATYDDGDAWTDVLMRVKLRLGGGTARLRLRDDGTDHYAVELTATTVKVFKVISGADTQLGSTYTVPGSGFPSDEYLLVDVSVYDDVLSVTVDTFTLIEQVQDGTGPLTAGTVGLEVVATSGGPVRFDDVEVHRLTVLGYRDEQLLSEPFTSLPSDWTFVDGTTPWAVSSTGHGTLDLSRVQDVRLMLEYAHSVVLN